MKRILKVAIFSSLFFLQVFIPLGCDEADPYSHFTFVVKVLPGNSTVPISGVQNVINEASQHSVTLYTDASGVSKIEKIPVLTTLEAWGTVSVPAAKPGYVTFNKIFHVDCYMTQFVTIRLTPSTTGKLVP